MSWNSDPGLVYYVLDASRLTLRVKIGFTTRLGARLEQLRSQTVTRQQPLVLALEDGDRLTEAERHKQFKRLWMHGEWFRYEDELESHLRTLPQPYGFINDRPDLWRFAKGWCGFEGWARTCGPPSLDEDIDEASARPAPIDFLRRQAMTTYHPDATINAEVAADTLEAERADLEAGYPPRAWICPCGASHSRGHFGSIGIHRCLACGYVGDGGVMELP